MGVTGPVSDLDTIIEALDGEDLPGAGKAIARIEAWIREGRSHESLYPAMKRVWDRFVSLLRRRGFFVGSPDEIEASLGEILSLGEGFDLHDLAVGLASLDAAAAQGGMVKSSLFFPRLSRFVEPGRPLIES